MRQCRSLYSVICMLIVSLELRDSILHRLELTASAMNPCNLVLYIVLFLRLFGENFFAFRNFVIILNFFYYNHCNVMIQMYI